MNPPTTMFQLSGVHCRCFQRARAQTAFGLWSLGVLVPGPGLTRSGTMRLGVAERVWGSFMQDSSACRRAVVAV